MVLIWRLACGSWTRNWHVDSWQKRSPSPRRQNQQCHCACPFTTVQTIIHTECSCPASRKLQLTTASHRCLKKSSFLKSLFFLLSKNLKDNIWGPNTATMIRRNFWKTPNRRREITKITMQRGAIRKIVFCFQMLCFVLCLRLRTCFSRKEAESVIYTTEHVAFTWRWRHFGRFHLSSSRSNSVTEYWWQK